MKKRLIDNTINTRSDIYKENEQVKLVQLFYQRIYGYAYSLANKMYGKILFDIIFYNVYFLISCKSIWIIYEISKTLYFDFCKLKLISVKSDV